MEIGRNIKILRQKNGLTQEALADRLGITYQAVSKWETDANTPDIALLPELARIFGTSIDSLFCGESENAPKSDIIKDDDVIRIVQMRGEEIIFTTDDTEKPIEIVFPKNCNDETQYFKVEVYGHVIADGSINGDVVCHQYIDCADINGNATAGQYIDCGDINGNIAVGQYIECGDVSGKIDAGQYVECDDVSGDVTAGESVDCGDVSGNVVCQGSIECESITGSIECHGNIEAEAITAEQIKCSGDINCDKIEYVN